MPLTGPRPPTEIRTAEQSKAALDNKSADDKAIGRLAALTPADQAASKQDTPAADIPRLLQTELRRVGCHTGAVDGNWNEPVQKSLALFNKNAGTTLDVKVASLGALDAVRARTSRTCPLVCDRGYKAEGDACTKITCKSGFELGDDNKCERIAPAKKPVAAAPARAPRTRGGARCPLGWRQVLLVQRQELLRMTSASVLSNCPRDWIRSLMKILWLARVAIVVVAALMSAAGARAQAPAASVSPPVCIYQSESYSEGAYLCIHKGLMLGCTANAGKVNWTVVADRELSNLCGARYRARLAPRQRHAQRRRPPWLPPSAPPPAPAAKCFVFNGKSYCE